MSSSQLVHKAFLAFYSGSNARLGLLAAVSVVSYAYSSIVVRLLDHIGWSLLASPQVAVAIVAICLLPQARARWSPSPAGSDYAKESASGGISAQQSHSRRRSIEGQARNCTQSCQLDCLSPSGDQMASRTHSYACTTKSRRRILPRISIELTPLPRLSLEFQRRVKSSRHLGSSSSRSSLDGASLGISNSGSLQDNGMCFSARWQPSMNRISSEQDLQLLDIANDSSVGGQTHADDSSAKIAFGEATESLGLNLLPAELQALGEVVTETHLLQVGALMGESSSRAALVAQEAGGPVNHPTSFYGSADTDEFLQPWDLLVSESNSNVLYWAWRRPLRKGLYMYMTRSVFMDASPAELRAFMNDDAYRAVWDSSMQILRPVLSRATVADSSGAVGSNAAVEAMAAAVAARTSGCGTPGSADQQSPFSGPAGDGTGSTSKDLVSSSSSYVHEDAIMQAMVQFPKPMASRSYIYGRRVWHRPSDGGCYCLAKSCEFLGAPALPGRAVAIDDYASGCVVKAPAQQLLPAGYSGPAAEVTLVYFEDSHVRPGLANMGVKKGLWPLVQRTEKALRVYQAGAAANVHLQPVVACSTPRLQRSVSMPSPDSLSRQGSTSQSLVSSISSAGVAPATAAKQQAQQAADDECSFDSGVDCAASQSREGVSEGSTTTLACSVAEVSANAVKVVGGTQQSSKQPNSKSSSKSVNGGRKGGGWGSWWSDVTAAVGSALKGSAQLLAAASVALWRSHTRVALLVPTLEWKLLHWVAQQVTAPKQLLLGAGPSSSSGVGDAGSSSSSKVLQRLASHPIGDWAHPGLLQRILQETKSSRGPSLLRVESHPLRVEELDVLQAESDATAAATCQHCSSCEVAAARSLQEGCRQQHQEPLLGLDWPSAAYSAAHSLHGHRHRRLGSVATEDAASQCGSTSGVSSSCSCSHCIGSYPTSHAPTSCASSNSRRCSHCGGCSASGGSQLGSLGGSVRVSGGGRRQRRVIVRLMQAASVRLAHKVISALEQPAAAATRD